tara:strand:+ start:325 stop:864 length:540 start_codon:yes stop_codon:yes gene_type:complete
MNIFILEERPYIASAMHCDKHVPKMIVESAQMLSTAHRILDGKLYKAPSKSGKRLVNHYQLSKFNETIYKAAYAGHPCTQWVMQSDLNYEYLFELFSGLLSEFVLRFEKTHKSSALLDALYNIPKNIPQTMELTPFVLAMPEECKTTDAVQSYRNYYHMYKSKFAKWEKGRSAPDWWQV